MDLRFTPTCVGTTLKPLSETKDLKVHPHVRGDNAHLPAFPGYAPGSPPRAWGQHDPELKAFFKVRFTPTCVGTTQNSQSQFRPCPVHPHVRGDNFLFLRGFGVSAGSPPRAWGQQRGRQAEILPIRFTPTCVGTTDPFCF